MVKFLCQRLSCFFILEKLLQIYFLRRNADSLQQTYGFFISEPGGQSLTTSRYSRLCFLGGIVATLISYSLQGAGRKGVPAVDFQVDYGMSTYKSKLVASSNTSSSNGYSLGLWGGDNKNINMTFAVDSNKTSFEYAKVTTKSSISLGLQDVFFRYRLGPMYLGMVFSQSNFEAVKEDVDYLNGISLGSGFNLGFKVEIRRGNTLYLDFTNVSSSETKETKQTTSTATMGPRTELNIGGKIKLSRSLIDLIIGYKSRNYSITVGDTTYEESLTSTVLGLGFNIFL